MKAAKKPNYGITTAFNIILQNWSVLLSFETLYRGIGFTLLFPFLQYLLSLLPGLVQQTYLGQHNISLVFRSPSALLLLILILLAAGLYVFFEITALFIYSEKGWHRKPLTVLGLWKEALKKCVKLLHPKRLAVFLLLPAMILSVFALTSGYLRHIKVPEFIMAFLKENIVFFWLFICVIIIFHLILFFYLFGFPILLFEDKSFLNSWKESRRLIKRKKLPIARKFIYFLLSLYSTVVLLTLCEILLIAGSVWIFYGNQDVRFQFQSLFTLYQNTWRVVSGAFVSVFLCTSITILYHQIHEETRPDGIKKRRNIFQKLQHMAMVLFTLFFLMIFGETEIAGNVWYPGEISCKVVAHRAGAAFAPENTLAALDEAVNDGASMAEIDVQQLRDGTLIVMHDTNFKRTTGVSLNVWDADYPEVQQMDAGSYFDFKFTGEPIPTLEEMLRVAKDRIQLMIEIKSTGHEQDIVSRTLDLINKNGMEKQCMIASMDINILKEVKQINPKMPTVYISVLLFSSQYDMNEIDAYSLETNSLSSGLVIQAHFQGKQVYGWTVNSESTIDKALKCGVDGLITDNPALAMYCIDKAYENILLNDLTDFFFPVSAEN